MAKVDIIRGFLVKHRQGLPPTAEGVEKYIRDVTRELNFRLSKKEHDGLMKEFVPPKAKEALKATESE